MMATTTRKTLLPAFLSQNSGCMNDGPMARTLASTAPR